MNVKTPITANYRKKRRCLGQAPTLLSKLLPDSG